jgi:hypothetical protein
MNEQVARDVVLVRAIETTDEKQEILSADDRIYASQSAKALAQWQAADAKSEATPDHFLQQRSEQILKRLSERHPAFGRFVKQRNPLNALAWILPILALLLGAGLDRITDPHRVDLLSGPLLLIIGWNLLVYISLVIWLFIPAKKQTALHVGWLRRFALRKTAVPRKLPHALSGALFKFLSDWSQLSARLTAARLARSVHLSAAMFAAGAMLSLYARGFLTQYVAGWESTFLNAGEVYGLLSLLFAPAMWAFQLSGFSIAEIEALRYGLVPTVSSGARWVHLYAATLFLMVVLPRLVLAAAASWKGSRIARKFPLDLNESYFRRLGGKDGVPMLQIHVFPYSFTLDEARIKGLEVAAASTVGETVRLVLHPALAYGETPPELLISSKNKDLNSPRVVALFNLAATPENENHGAFLDHMSRLSSGGLVVWIDESVYLERLGPGRIQERIALWREFCNFHHCEASIVNCLQRAEASNGKGAL